MMFPTVITPAALTVAANNALVFTLGSSTIINLTSTPATTTIISLAAVGGNIDGMVVCFSNINATGLNFAFTNESGTEATPANRFRCGGATTITIAQYGAATFRWSAVSQRWQSIGKI